MTKIDWNFDAFEQIRRSDGVVSDINSRASRIASSAGEGFESSPYRGASRHRASVITATTKARVKNAKENTLLRAIDAGR